MKGVGEDVSAENAAILGAIGAPDCQVNELAGENKSTFTGGGRCFRASAATFPRGPLT